MMHTIICSQCGIGKQKSGYSIDRDNNQTDTRCKVCVIEATKTQLKAEQKHEIETSEWAFLTKPLV